MDERQSGNTPHQRDGSDSPAGASASVRAMRKAPQLADVATHDGVAAPGASATDATNAEPAPPDPRDPHTMERLLRRTPSKGYVIADTEVVRAIRAWDAHGDTRRGVMLLELLLDRCMPEFRRRAAGLRHRPDLMDEAISAMIEQVLVEARNPNEVFMTQNFIHYLKCVCIDNFNRTLRQEGLRFKRDAQGRPIGRPQHIPRALIERIDLRLDDQDDPVGPGAAVADPHDRTAERLAAVEAQRILQYLPDPLDRRIMALRVFEGRQWEDIATMCGKTERTMRLRYERARKTLQDCLRAEQHEATTANGDTTGDTNNEHE